jgi:hypothetical protein
MTIHRFAAAVAASLIALSPAIARADLYCPQQVSIFGTVTAVSPSMMTLHSTSSMGYVHVRLNHPTTNAHGMRLRPGVFAGVYGCLERGGQTFTADELTLASSADAYAGYAPRHVTIEGRVTAVQNGRVLIAANGGHGDVWVRGTVGRLRVGDDVRATGSFDPHDSGFVASGIERSH